MTEKTFWKGILWLSKLIRRGFVMLMCMNSGDRKEASKVGNSMDKLIEEIEEELRMAKS
jgi:hypothetical protein